ncbi:thiamine-phosphate synthase family protein [Natranaeroarchaeum sulfidigenes]|uniref:Putative transcriptional regulator fused phosphomethylpyrimidine kinase, involved in the thiamine biosynthesis n=1 Tax=Natranaeroarchaeum sulfidigenes TaxID=2784880 RepID=A0A897MVS3_9EURY|nr:thiamine-phosphate synthase family protein [Natranaeroarchaeum sulfidigenes]QSG03173.1 putative transcriptional regulator fused phosphomethylpyrimidine kinase, involved in the thiamine biosynthesis [Natranaeroarchaeum sulfidigenes]
MQFIEEIVVEEFLPTFRSMLAEELRERDLTQNEVATVLGISQSAVSKYVHGDVSRNERIETDERVIDLIEEIADGLTTGDMRPVQALVEAEVLIRQLEDGDILAKLHQEAVPELAEYDTTIRIHDPENDLRSAERVLTSVRRGLRMLENASGFAGLIPNVGSNLVVCLPEADSVDDVAGVPGRIFDVKGKATIPGDPEFGVSEHVASILLATRQHGGTARAAVNLRYDPHLVERFAGAGYETVEFDAEAETSEAIRESMADADDPTILYQTGGYGIEPIVYVLGEDAETVAGIVREIL